MSDESKTTVDIIKERLKLWQILAAIVLFILGWVSPLALDGVAWVRHKINPPIICNNLVKITYPNDGQLVYGNDVDVVGFIKPNEKCKHLFVIVESVDGYKFWFVADTVPVNPDGSWSVVASLEFFPPGSRVRIHARLCSKCDVYPIKGCLEKYPSVGKTSKYITIKRAG